MATTHDVEQALRDSGIVYRVDGRWYVGIVGDSDVTDLVEEVVDKLSDLTN